MYIDIQRILPRIETPLFPPRVPEISLKILTIWSQALDQLLELCNEAVTRTAKINVYRSSKCVNRSKCEPNVDMRHAYENSMACIESILEA